MLETRWIWSASASLDFRGFWGPQKVLNFVVKKCTKKLQKILLWGGPQQGPPGRLPGRPQKWKQQLNRKVEKWWKVWNIRQKWKLVDFGVTQNGPKVWNIHQKWTCELSWKMRKRWKVWNIRQKWGVGWFWCHPKWAKSVELSSKIEKKTPPGGWYLGRYI